MREFLDEYGGAIVALLLFGVIMVAFGEVFHLCKTGSYLVW